MTIKKKICVTTGSRSEYGILKPLLHEIQKSKKLELILLVAGMHHSKKFGYTKNEIIKDGFKISGNIQMTPKSDSNFDMSYSVGKGIIEFSKIFKKIKPHLNLVLGDRIESLSSVIAASYMNIPNAHIHGGERSKAGIDEYNRHAITKFSNIHFAVSKSSLKRIIKLGENPKNVFLTGSPSIDGIVREHIPSKSYLAEKYNLKLNKEEVLLIYHPTTTNSLQTSKEITNILNALKKLKKNVLSISSNSDAGNLIINTKLKDMSKHFPYFQFYKNIPRKDFLGLLNYMGVLLGNSSSGLIEASYFPITVINVGERQLNRERGNNVIDVKGISSTEIYRELSKVLYLKKKSTQKQSFIFGKGVSSKKIVKILEKTNLSSNLLEKQIEY